MSKPIYEKTNGKEGNTWRTLFGNNNGGRKFCPFHDACWRFNHLYDDGRDDKECIFKSFCHYFIFSPHGDFYFLYQSS